MQVQKDTCTHIFIIALLQKVRYRNNLCCLAVGARIKKMWYINTVEYYSAIENEMLAFATTWVDHEGITLHESLNF